MTNPSQPTTKVADHVASQLIEIFRAGRQTDMHGREIEFTRADLADMAAGYDPDASEAPLVVGHPVLNGPAYGWVRGLSVDGDVLSAQLHQVEPAFADMVRAGRFKKRSASFFLPDSKDNPTPGKFYLRHVGFLGASAPAVKGLKEVSFADNDAGCIEFADVSSSPRFWAFGHIADLLRNLRDRAIEADGLEKANALLPDYQIESIREASREVAPPPGPAFAAPAAIDDITNEDTTVTQQSNVDLAARELSLTARETAIAAEEAKVAERAQAARRSESVSFADTLVSAGKLLPKDKATVVELMLALPTEQPLSFASGDATLNKPAGELFRTLLEELPQRIDFAEKSADTGTSEGAASFAAPTGSRVDARQLELHRNAAAYHAEHPGISFLAAAKAVGAA